jgi:phenylacetate-CoA ligase
VIVAGEPGGNIAPTRAQIERGWGARVIDHHGLTEVGPVSFECWEAPGTLHLNECEFICEVVDPTSGTPVPDGETGELVITNLGRTASPVIRYRTRDIVRLRREPCRCGRTLVRAEGGILSRADDMVSVRGVNVYPTAIEAVIRRFPDVVEYRSTVSSRDALHSLTIEVELGLGAPDDSDVTTRVAQALREGMGLTVPVRAVAPQTLPRFEMKARRFVVEDDA